MRGEKEMLETAAKVGFNGHSMVGILERVLVCSPRTAGWDKPERAVRWKDLGFHHAPDFATAQAQHEALCRELEAAEAEIFELPPSPDISLDAVYTHDAFLPTGHGVMVMLPGKVNRVCEGPHQGVFCEGLSIPVLGNIVAPGTSEAGDILWLYDKTLLIGGGERTHAGGIPQRRGIQAV